MLTRLAAGGREALDGVVAELVAETESAMAALGAATVAAVTAEMVRPADLPPRR
jgi:isopentenyl diphosphate isomerase/L-lactate dehydrogenase-like FMN-dependent dehydrogenase